ncbi:MAG: phosphate ABC transporter substrate-binding protein [Acidobacteriota bacterium]
MTFCSPTKASRRVVGICCLAALTGFAAMTLGCRQPEENANRVRVSGASTVYPIIVLAGEALKASGSRLEIQAQAGGSTRGFEDTLAGRNDLGAMAREPTAEEAAQIRQFPIAYDGVGVVVHGSNRVEHITTEDLRRIYRKEITDWAALGGEEESIVVVTKAEGHATLETFLEHTGLDRGALQVDVVGGDNAQVIRVVANTPGAIGYVSLGEVLHSIEIDIPLRLLELDGVAPTLEHVASRHYPMFRTLYLVSREEPQGASRTLLDYLRTAEGRRIIEQGRYVPVDD